MYKFAHKMYKYAKSIKTSCNRKDYLGRKYFIAGRIA